MSDGKPNLARPKVGFVGLGIMGGGMAESLLTFGYAVVGFDVSAAACARLEQAGGKVLASASEVALAADTVITSLAKPAILLSTATEIAAVASRPRPQPLVVIETSTFTLADKMAAAERVMKAGAIMLDCPISGTATRLPERTWTIFVSGDEAACARVHDILQVFADNTPYVGGFGDGTRMKYIANHLVAILNVATGESLTFARKMGLDPAKVMALFGPSPVVGTGVMRLRGEMMVHREYTPPTMKVEVWQKDMQVIGDMAKSVECPVPLFNTCAPIYTSAMAQGLSQSDTASVCEVLGRMAGVPEK
jgi:L-threonate 2-dehydrogenase